MLDNFEQIIGGAPTLADLLAQAPHVKLIVTSREPLHIAGEQVFPVPPLALPDSAHPRTRSDCRLRVGASVRRARAGGGAWLRAHARRMRAAVAELCVRLDGLPLALELGGGARVRSCRRKRC